MTEHANQHPKHGLLVIGASQSGVALAGSLRALGWEDPITLLGDEDHRPYQRPATAPAITPAGPAPAA